MRSCSIFFSHLACWFISLCLMSCNSSMLTQKAESHFLKRMNNNALYACLPQFFHYSSVDEHELSGCFWTLSVGNNAAVWSTGNLERCLDSCLMGRDADKELLDHTVKLFILDISTATSYAHHFISCFLFFIFSSHFFCFLDLNFLSS